jgi:hypothetical protein
MREQWTIFQNGSRGQWKKEVEDNEMLITSNTTMVMNGHKCRKEKEARLKRQHWY